VEAVAAAIRAARRSRRGWIPPTTGRAAATVYLTVERYDILHNNAVELDAATIGQDSQADILTLAPELLKTEGGAV
jgi:hypothetical protein